MENRIKPRISRLALLAITTFVLGACGAKQTGETAGVSEANLPDRIQHAQTPADHQDIARYYEAEAQTAERKTEKDHELRQGYQRAWPAGMPGPAGMVGDYGFQAHEFEHGAEAHYDQLSERSKDESREYHALADEHRHMAAQLERGPRRADE